MAKKNEVSVVNANQLVEKKSEGGLIAFLKSLTYGIMYNPEEGKLDVKVADTQKNRDVAITFRQGNTQNKKNKRK
jgi:hypothetical protein